MESEQERDEIMRHLALANEFSVTESTYSYIPLHPAQQMKQQPQ